MSAARQTLKCKRGGGSGKGMRVVRANAAMNERAGMQLRMCVWGEGLAADEGL